MTAAFSVIGVGIFDNVLVGDLRVAVEFSTYCAPIFASLDVTRL